MKMVVRGKFPYLHQHQKCAKSAQIDPYHHFDSEEQFWKKSNSQQTWINLILLNNKVVLHFFDTENGFQN